MAQTRGGKGLRGSGGNKALLLIELKNRILSALNKLADRDTQQLAVEDLERLSESLSSEGLSMLLSCLYDFTGDAQQKSVVRRECIKMFGTLATLHPETLKPHLHKIVANIVRRLKDPDSSIREACVEAMGILAAQIPAGGGAGAEAGSSISIFVKPLLEALGEQNRNLQVSSHGYWGFVNQCWCCSLLFFFFIIIIVSDSCFPHCFVQHPIGMNAQEKCTCSSGAFEKDPTMRSPNNPCLHGMAGGCFSVSGKGH
jgi:hypothetical protein